MAEKKKSRQAGTSRQVRTRRYRCTLEGLRQLQCMSGLREGGKGAFGEMSFCLEMLASWETGQKQGRLFRLYRFSMSAPDYASNCRGGKAREHWGPTSHMTFSDVFGLPLRRLDRECPKDIYLQEKDKGDIFELTFGGFWFTIELFAYSPFRCLLEALSCCKQKRRLNCK